MASNIPVIVQGNSFSLAIPLQIYYINGDQMDLEDYTPDPTDEVSIQLKGSRRNYTYTPTITDNIAYIDLSGNELADNYAVVVSIVKANGQRLRSFRTDQFFIVESSDDLTMDDIIEGLEENVIYLNSSIFVAGEDGRGIESIVKTSTAGLVDTYTITYSDNTTSTFDVTNGAAGEAGASIATIEKTATSGLVDTYTITLTNGNTSTFEVTNGMDGVDLGLANIVNDLTTGGSTNVLSAEMGKLIASTTMMPTGAGTETLTPALEQGGMMSDGSKQITQDVTFYRRVRTQDFIRVYGAFTLTAPTGYTFNAFWYSQDNDSSYVGQIGAWSSSYSGNYNGYIRFGVRKADGTVAVTPSDVTITMTRAIPAGYAPRILDVLDSTATDYALSANQGKVIGDNLFGLNGVMPLEQGGILADGTRMPSSDTGYPNRVVSPPLKVDGAFTVQVGAQGFWNVHFYNEAGDNVKQVWQSGAYIDATSQTAYTGDWHGYIRVLFKKTSAGTTACTPSDFSLTLTNKSLEARVASMEQLVPDLTTLTMPYIGEKIAIADNKFKALPYCLLPANPVQSIAIYGDYVLLLDYDSSKAFGKLYKLSDGTLLATLNLPNSIYKRAHCNACSFSDVFNSADSIMPLLYVSQWDNDSEHGCFVYDFKLTNGTYSVDLVQTILPTNVSTATRGAGQTDWVVDPRGFIYSVGYLLDNSATIISGNKTMIAKYPLPAVSDGAVVTFGDADVLDHFDVKIYTARQDIIFNNGRILMLAGLMTSSDPTAVRRLVVIDPEAKAISSLVKLDYIDEEPEGINVKDGQLIVGFWHDPVLYKFNFD